MLKNAGKGMKYKYRIYDNHGNFWTTVTPMRFIRICPETASVVYGLSDYPSRISLMSGADRAQKHGRLTFTSPCGFMEEAGKGEERFIIIGNLPPC